MKKLLALLPLLFSASTLAFNEDEPALAYMASPGEMHIVIIGECYGEKPTFDTPDMLVDWVNMHKDDECLLAYFRADNSVNNQVVTIESARFRSVDPEARLIYWTDAGFSKEPVALTRNVELKVKYVKGE